MKRKYREYAFLTTCGSRIEVKAMTPKQAYARCLKEAKKFGVEITKSYQTYGLMTR
jgi:hypothetical protein